MTTLAEIERHIAHRHLLQHPFYTAWSRGELPIETLREYAGQYYHFEANFPRYVAGAYAKLLASRDRKVLPREPHRRGGQVPDPSGALGGFRSRHRGPLEGRSSTAAHPPHTTVDVYL